MKTSEFIRNAVDTYLAHGDDVSISGQANKGNGLVYLCICLQRMRNDMLVGLDRDSEEAKRAYAVEEIAVSFINDCISDVIPSANRLDFYTFFDPGAVLGYWKTLEESKYELQEIRFMLAEFMALYFEDQGD